MIWEWSLLLTITASMHIVFCQNQSAELDLDDLIASVFGTNPELNNNEDSVNKNTEVVLQNTSGENSIDQDENCECIPRNFCKNEEKITNRCPEINYVCCSLPRKPTPKPVRNSNGCGIRNPNGVGFLINHKHNETEFGEFPWMVAILYEALVDGKTFNIYQCGGSLIHPKVVLTAAHCVSDKSKQGKFKIRAGEWDTQSTNELYPHQDRRVKSIKIHEHFFKQSLHNDIALLVLDTPVEIAENVDVACLPPENVEIDTSKCFATGWGKNVFGQEGRFQVILKKVELPIVSRKKCVKSLRRTRLGRRFQLHSSFMCAGGEPGQDTCKGDGGSPLVCPVKGGKLNQFHQLGMVSWGIGCGENNTPGIYVNISYFRQWIDEQMISERLDRSFYMY